MKQNPIPKVIALILVSFGIAWLTLAMDASALSKIDSMTPADYIQYERHLHSHSFVFHFITLLILGGFYIGVIEFISYVIGLVIPKKPDA
jgi:hypothetical protein